MSTYYTIRQFARDNRKNPTPAEKLFWHNARGRKIGGLKFLRQYIFEYRLFENSKGFFIADFYCAELKLVVELDGRIHDYQKEYDDYRTEILKGLGLSVIRFANEDVLGNWEVVEEEILSFTDSS
jgi:leucyl-tRNA synthetase